MLKLTRRIFLAGPGAAAGAAAAWQASQAADVRRTTGLPYRRLVSGPWAPEKLAGALLPRERWKPYPTLAERAPWEGLPAEARRSLVAAGERQVGAPWPALPATLFLEYVRNGNRSNYERVRGARRDRLRELVLAECIEARGRLLDEIGNGVWATCEETYWGVPAHLNLQKRGSGLPDVTEPTIDLFAAETSNLLAWTEYLLGPQLDKVHPLLRERIRLEIDRRVLAPFRQRDDFWWMGLSAPAVERPMNNWNPWINSNCLTCALLVEPDPARRTQAVHKVLRSLDRFLDSYHDDGGCDEGPGYWSRAGGSLFDNLELLHSASAGAIDFYSMPLVREIGRYIYRTHIHDTWFTNFADASARVHISADLVFRYGRRIGDANMQALGAWAAQQQDGDPARADSIGRQLAALFNLPALRQAPARQPLVRDVWLPGIQVMAARRKEGSPEGFYLAALGGHNAESHNHNDVGNFIVYCDGQPVIIDVGVETYTAQTFSSRRYEIWTMQSAYHNLPTVNGVMQGAGYEFAARDVAYRADDSSAQLSLDIAGAYPPEAGLQTWKRTLRLDRAGNEIEVHEVFVLRRPGGRITLSLMTPCHATQSGAGELTLAGGLLRSGKVRLLFDAQALVFSTEEIRIIDARLRSAWGERLYRVLLTADKAPPRAEWRLRFLEG
jgi:hypothetical protein